MRRVLSLFVLFWGGAYAAQAQCLIPQPPDARRLVVFISDTHFGPGPGTGRPFHPYEDFRWAKQFALFLQRIDRDGAGHTDLVLNGDTFELWQPVDPKSCTGGGRSADEGCTEEEALQRMEIVLNGHPDELAALRTFADSGSNRIFLVPGNHDAALLFARVRKQVIDRIKAKPGRVEIPASGYYLSPDKSIYAEHGHQLDDPNALPGWPVPFRGLKRYLARPWGENFVATFYNPRELTYEAIDNIAGVANGIRYGVASEGKSKTAKAVVDFGKYLLVGQSVKQFVSVLKDQGSNGDAPQWDIDAVRRGGERFVVDSIPTDDPAYENVAAAYKEGKLGLTVSLSDAEIQEICDFRYAANLQQQEIDKTRPPDQQRPLTIQPCQQKTLMAGVKKLASLADKYMFLAAHIDAAYDQLKNDQCLKGNEKFDFVVLSHTHTVEEPFNPYEHTFRTWQPQVVNTGAWQRIGTVEDVRQLATDNHWKNEDVLRELKPEMLPDCYSAVIVRPGAPPDVRVMWWEQVKGVWDLVENSKSRCHR